MDLHPLNQVPILMAPLQPATPPVPFPPSELNYFANLRTWLFSLLILVGEWIKHGKQTDILAKEAMEFCQQLAAEVSHT